MRERWRCGISLYPTSDGLHETVNLLEQFDEQNELFAFKWNVNTNGTGNHLQTCRQFCLGICWLIQETLLKLIAC